MSDRITGGSFVTTLPYSDNVEWAKRGKVVSRSRARQDLGHDRAPVNPGPRHVWRVFQALRRGDDVVLYSACPHQLDLVALLLARLLVPGRIGTVVFTGDMWEPGSGYRVALVRRLLQFLDRCVAAWVVHSADDAKTFDQVWEIDGGKVHVAPYGVTADWGNFPARRHDRPYVFVGGNSQRDFEPVLEAARLLPDVDFVVATTMLDGQALPSNVQLTAVDRSTYQAAIRSSALTLVPLRKGLARSAGQQTYLNAMRLGTVVAVVGGPGVHEHVVDGVDGRIVDGTAKGYVDVIRWVLNADNASEVRAMREAAVRSAEDQPFDLHVTGILNVLDRAIGQPVPATRVGMIMQSYLPVVGGAQQQVAQLLPLLDGHDIAADIVTRSVEGSPAKEKTPSGWIHRLSVAGPAHLRSVAFTVAAVAKLRKLRPDVLHAFDLLSPTTTALATKRLLGIPVVVKILRGGELGDLARLRAKPLGAVRLRWMCRTIDRAVVISDEIEQELLDAGFSSNQLVRIDNGVDLARFSPADDAERVELRTRLGLDSKPMVIFTGRLNPEKRVDLLIDVWPEVIEKVGPSTLLIVGDGPERQRLRAAAGDQVHFVGALPDVTEHLRASDVFVLPSSTEGLSNSLLEAMAAGLGVVCTKVGGAGDVLDHRASGLLIAPDDREALRDALIEVLADAELRDRFGRAARATMQERFSLEGTAQRLAELYRSLSRRHTDDVLSVGP